MAILTSVAMHAASSEPSHSADTSIIDITGPDLPLPFNEVVSLHHVAQSVQPTDSYTTPDYIYEMPRLGKLYRKKLDLSKQEADWLNKFWSPQNVFIAIEGCRVATIRLYLEALAKLEIVLAKRHTSLAQEATWSKQESIKLRKVASAVAGYSWSGYDTQYLEEQTEPTLYSTLFRRCENVVREVYGNKRRLAAEFSGLEASISERLESSVGEPLNELLSTLHNTIATPDEATDIALNVQNVTRWKLQLDQLAAQLTTTTIHQFVAGVYELGQRNFRNPAIENIFFDACKLVAKFDREEALRFYVHYIHYDLRSAALNNKPLAKTILKSLFPQPDQLQRLEEIIRQQLASKDMNQALAQLPTVYARQRKKIQLDLGSIQQVQHQHAGTVELLNEYLQDEPEAVTAPADTALAALAVDTEEVQLAVVAPAAQPAQSAFNSDLGLSTTQELLLSLFAEQSFTLPQAEVEAFARQHGALRNQLIDSINEQCYEQLDDVLIEEDGDAYTLYDSYYQKLTATC